MRGAPVESNEGRPSVNCPVDDGGDRKKFGALVVLLVRSQASMGDEQGEWVACQEWGGPRAQGGGGLHLREEQMSVIKVSFHFGKKYSGLVGFIISKLAVL